MINCTHMKNQQQKNEATISLIKSPKLFRKMFRSTEDIRQGKVTPLFTRRRKGGVGGKIYPKDDSSLRSPTTSDATNNDGFFNGTFPRSPSTTSFMKTSQQVSFDEELNGENHKLPMPLIEASDNENDDHANIPDNNNDSGAAMTPVTEKKNKKKRYRRFTKIYTRSKNNNKAKCQDDDKVYKARSGKMKDKALEINV